MIEFRTLWYLVGVLCDWIVPFWLVIAVRGYCFHVRVWIFLDCHRSGGGSYSYIKYCLLQCEWNCRKWNPFVKTNKTTSQTVRMECFRQQTKKRIPSPNWKQQCRNISVKQYHIAYCCPKSIAFWIGDGANECARIWWASIMK